MPRDRKAGCRKRKKEDLADTNHLKKAVLRDREVGFTQRCDYTSHAHTTCTEKPCSDSPRVLDAFK